MHYTIITSKNCFDAVCLISILTHDKIYQSHSTICGKVIEEKHICVYSFYKKNDFDSLLWGFLVPLPPFIPGPTRELA